MFKQPPAPVPASASSQVGTQQTGIGRPVRDTADDCQPQIDGSGRVMALLEVDAIAENRRSEGTNAAMSDRREAWIVPILNSIAQNRVRFSLGRSGSIQLNCNPFPLVSAPARESS